MSQPLEIAGALIRRTWVRAGGALLAVLGVAAGGLPLLEAPGYELGQLAALAAALLAPGVGIAAARAGGAAGRGRSRSRATTPGRPGTTLRPGETTPGAPETTLGRPADPHPEPSPLAAWAAAALVLAGLVGLLVGGAVARAALGPCRAFGPAAAFVPLLALPSVLLGAAVAVAVTFVAGGRRALAVGLYLLVALASLAASLAAAYRGPAAFVFDPLLGGWPGPIYDEALVPDLRVLLVRLAAAAEAIAVAAVTAAFVRGERAGAGPGPRAALRAARAPLALCLAAVAGAACAHLALERLGLSGSRAAIARALGATRQGARCTVVLPAEKPEAAAAALVAECDFQAADVARALGIPPPERVVAYVYRSADEKRRLVGAAATEYAKPWLAEIHLVDGPGPHPLLRHELVHAVAAPVAGGPLGVPARGVVLVSAGLVEGLAAALETPRGRWTVHEWSRAARDLGLLPDAAAIVGPAGFYGQPPARAYTAAGSFLAFLLERHGAGRVREVYRTGDPAAATGVPLADLAAQWHRFLDAVEPAPGLAHAARSRLGRGSLFARACAREVAALEGRAARAAAAGRTEEACALYGEAAARPGSAGALKAAGDVRARAGDLEGAARAYREAALAAGEGDPALRLAVAAAQGDLAWRRGEPAEAAAAWSSVLGTRPERGEARLLEAKLAAAADPALAAIALPLLLGDGDPSAALVRLAEVDHPLAAYLAGRARAVRGEAAAAVPLLARAVAGRLPAELAQEAGLLLGEARCASGDRPGGVAALRALARAGAAGGGAGGGAGSAAARARAEEAVRRCAGPEHPGGPGDPDRE